MPERVTIGALPSATPGIHGMPWLVVFRIQPPPPQAYPVSFCVPGKQMPFMLGAPSGSVVPKKFASGCFATDTTIIPLPTLSPHAYAKSDVGMSMPYRALTV